MSWPSSMCICGNIAGALAFLDVAHVQRSSNPRACQRLPAIVDRHSPKGPQPQRDAVQAGMQHTGPPAAGKNFCWCSCSSSAVEGISPNLLLAFHPMAEDPHTSQCLLSPVFSTARGSIPLQRHSPCVTGLYCIIAVLAVEDK